MMDMDILKIATMKLKNNNGAYKKGRVRKLGNLGQDNHLVRGFPGFRVFVLTIKKRLHAFYEISQNFPI